MLTKKSKFTLLGISVLLVFWNPSICSNDMDIRFKHVAPIGYSDNGHIEVYVNSNNMNGILNCTIYCMTDKKLKEYNENNKNIENIKILPKNIVNTTNIYIDNHNNYKNPICKITLQENMNMFSVPNYMSEIATKKGTIIDKTHKFASGRNGFSYYKNLLIKITFTSVNGNKTTYTTKTLTSTDYA